MYLMRYFGDTGSGPQVETHLFMSEEAAKAFMKTDYERERELCAKFGAALPTETSQEDEEYYTDISEDEIRVYQAGDVMVWQVVEIMPEDMPESLKEPVKGGHEITTFIGRFIDEDGEVSIAVTPGDPMNRSDDGDDQATEVLADMLDCDLEADTANGAFDWDANTIGVPDTVANRIKVDGIREFLSGPFNIEPCGYGIFMRDSIAEEIERIDAVNLFENDEAAVAQAIKDGIKLIPVEELPEGLEEDLRYLGWIDTPDNRARLYAYCDKNQEEL